MAVHTLCVQALFAVVGISSAFGQVQFNLSGPQQYVCFGLTTETTATPVVIDAADNGAVGSIFFETASGKQWLCGEPVSKDDSNADFKGRWQAGENLIAVSFAAEGSDYIISLTNEQGPEVLRWGLNFKASKQDYFTGLFERVVDGRQTKSWAEGITAAMNLRGQKVSMLIEPTLGLYCPFYISSAGYGLFVNDTWPGVYDLCSEYDNLVQVAFEGPSFKCRLYTAKTPGEIIRRHTLATGPVFVPAKWAFGPWRWRDSNQNSTHYYDGTPVGAPYNSELVEDILMMAAYDVPCSAYLIDRPWGPGEYGYDDFEWDPKRFPKAAEMIQWLSKNDIQTVLWIAPWVMGNMAKEATEKGYDLKGIRGDNLSRVSMDFTHPQGCRWWQENGPGKMLRQGVKGFKLDRAEEVEPQTRDIKVFDGRTTRQTRNDYPVQYVRATHDICAEIAGDDFVLIPRAGYTGSSRYSAFWGGDIRGTAEGLRAAIIAQQRASVLGFGIWGSDTCGYGGMTIDHEVSARWMAFSCFSPLMEVGPTNNKGFWDMKSEPSYDSDMIAIWRLYTKLHATLVDYTYTCAQEYRRTGQPIVRPLFMVYPEQKAAWEQWQLYQYGPDILVYAIWEKNVRTAEVYLPAGQEWRDAWTNTTYQGGQTVKIDTPLYKIPIFLTKDSTLNLGDLNQLYRESLEKARVKPDLKKMETELFSASAQ